MKRIMSCLLVLAMLFAVMTGCQSNGGEDQNGGAVQESQTPDTQQPEDTAEPGEDSAASPEAAEETATFRIGGLKGPTSMGMVKFLKDAEDGNSALSCEFTLAAAADELASRVMSSIVSAFGTLAPKPVRRRKRINMSGAKMSRRNEMSHIRLLANICFRSMPASIIPIIIIDAGPIITLTLSIAS